MSSSSSSENNKRKRVSDKENNSFESKKQKTTVKWSDISDYDKLFEDVKSGNLDPNLRDHRGDTLLHHLSYWASSVNIGKLFETGAYIDIYSENNGGLTPLQILYVTTAKYEEDLLQAQDRSHICEQIKKDTSLAAVAIVKSEMEKQQEAKEEKREPSLGKKSSKKKKNK